MGIAGGGDCRAARGRPPFRTAGLLGPGLGTGAGGCGSLRGVDGRAGTPGAGGMDLEASLLPTGPNASNTSESPDNLTSAGEMRWRAGLPPLRRRGWETGRFHL